MQYVAVKKPYGNATDAHKLYNSSYSLYFLQLETISY